MMVFGKVMMVAVASAGLAGCMTAGSSSRTYTGPLTDEPTPRITERQAADVHVALGRSLEKRGDNDQALASYLEAAKRDPKNAEASWRAAILYDRQGNFRASNEE